MYEIHTIRQTGAEPFRPHQFETKQEAIGRSSVPQILIDPEVYADMLTITQLSGYNEVGWLGSVRMTDDNQYLIEKIFMIAQEVSGSETELTEDGMADFFANLAESDQELCARIMFWGHVHPGNSTSASGQDNTQMAKFNHNEWFIRGIFGRNGRAEFSFYDYKRGVIWNDVPWQVACPMTEERTARWQAEMDEKVQKIVFTGTGQFKNYAGYTPPVLPVGSRRKLHRARSIGLASVVGWENGSLAEAEAEAEIEEEILQAFEQSGQLDSSCITRCSNGFRPDDPRDCNRCIHIDQCSRFDQEE